MSDASANRQVETVEFTMVVMGSKVPRDPIQDPQVRDGCRIRPVAPLLSF